ncbi:MULTISPECIES: hypothetical protein [unclassified Leeuwenhoekiella]|uniref:hypothetical protein n=1 Tax=unclassified Leeuwenhoekiella TaxID=2615029 RepID=UPI000C40AA9C|nr:MULTISPECIES: hypothetical protein [unclassified Leeuwenhoekiella]MAW95980.1 hypothetical protein [Leeuwenhoekiella sp.]MBA79974.1 hypothetical protein [Leeuwenhoekiella sp.]|tara:strand:- start:28496 stop:28873 length:378 start_codon:yes stop_codon:yes gene_type:complete
MITLDKDTDKNTQILEQAIGYLEDRGFENIKADTEGFESPKSYIKKGSEVSITPDIVAERDGEKHIFELSLKSKKPRLLKSKWLFLDVLSSMKNFKFKIMTTRGHYKFTDETLSSISLDKKPVKI